MLTAGIGYPTDFRPNGRGRGTPAWAACLYVSRLLARRWTLHVRLPVIHDIGGLRPLQTRCLHPV